MGKQHWHKWFDGLAKEEDLPDRPLKVYSPHPRMDKELDQRDDTIEMLQEQVTEWKDEVESWRKRIGPIVGDI